MSRQPGQQEHGKRILRCQVSVSEITDQLAHDEADRRGVNIAVLYHQIIVQGLHGTFHRAIVHPVTRKGKE